MKEFYKSLLLSLNDDETNEKESEENLLKLFDRIRNSKSSGDSLMDDELQNQNNFEYNLEQRYLEDENLENPFLVNRKLNHNNRFSNLNKLFVSSERVDLGDYKSPRSLIDFNTDTKIDFFGGLTIWQITAILIAFLMFIALSVFLIKKLNTLVYKISSPSNVNNLANARSGSVRTNYSTDSTNHLLSKNFTFKKNQTFDIDNTKSTLPDYV